MFYELYYIKSNNFIFYNLTFNEMDTNCWELSQINVGILV